MRPALDKTAVKLLCAVIGWNILVLVVVFLAGFGKIKVSDSLLITALVSTAAVYGLVLSLWWRKRAQRRRHNRTGG